MEFLNALLFALSGGLIFYGLTLKTHGILKKALRQKNHTFLLSLICRLSGGVLLAYLLLTQKMSGLAINLLCFCAVSCTVVLISFLRHSKIKKT
jgi:hypothetical protein